jgi:hypothetical protein
MPSPIIVIAVFAFCCLAGIIVILSQRYSSSSISLYRYVKFAYPEKYEDLLKTHGKILTVVTEGSANVSTEISLLKSGFKYQFIVLKQIAQINLNDQELQRQIASMSSTLKVALGLLYVALVLTLLAFVAWYVIAIV